MSNEKLIIQGWHLCDIGCKCDRCHEAPSAVIAELYDDESPWGYEMELCNSCIKELQLSMPVKDEIADIFQKVLAKGKEEGRV